jgi:hypothetical protein
LTPQIKTIEILEYEQTPYAGALKKLSIAGLVNKAKPPTISQVQENHRGGVKSAGVGDCEYSMEQKS